MGVDEKRGQKHPGTTPAPSQMKKGGRWEEEGKGEEVQGRRAGVVAPLASHPLQEGPGLLHSVLALLLKFQFYAQPSWHAASHVPAPGQAAGSGARGGHMDEQPGSTEQSAWLRAAVAVKLRQEQPSLPAISMTWNLQSTTICNLQEYPLWGGWGQRRGDIQ